MTISVGQTVYWSTTAPAGKSGKDKKAPAKKVETFSGVVKAIYNRVDDHFLSSIFGPVEASQVFFLVLPDEDKTPVVKTMDSVSEQPI